MFKESSVKSKCSTGREPGKSPRAVARGRYFVGLGIFCLAIIGLGLVFGAHLNAALAVVPESALKGRDPSPEEGVT